MRTCSESYCRKKILPTESPQTSIRIPNVAADDGLAVPKTEYPPGPFPTNVLTIFEGDTTLTCPL